mmetsp:Transcript_21846/g.35743  ORF Transcript_21846/g.35743 Transcript_21846/m.35743 type:complete len:80 (-) Transcript_21846:82-321(-)
MDWMGGLRFVLVMIGGMRWQLEWAMMAWVGRWEWFGRSGIDILGMSSVVLIWRVGGALDGELEMGVMNWWHGMDGVVLD